MMTAGYALPALSAIFTGIALEDYFAHIARPVRNGQEIDRSIISSLWPWPLWLLIRPN